jgi:hypothetical protein
MKTLHGIGLLILLAVVILFVYEKDAKCKAEGRVLVRGVFWLECVKP